jgi:hypothetical protein
MRKLMLVILMEMILLVHTSSHPNVIIHYPPHSHLCLQITLEKCRELPKILELEECIIFNFFQCIYKSPSRIPILKLYAIAVTCVRSCYQPPKITRGVQSAYCLLDCCEKHIKEHWDVVSLVRLLHDFSVSSWMYDFEKYLLKFEYK